MRRKKSRKDRETIEDAEREIDEDFREEIVKQMGRRDFLKRAGTLAGVGAVGVGLGSMLGHSLASPGAGAGGTTITDEDIDAKRIAGVRIASEFITGAVPAGTPADPYPGSAIQAAIDDLPAAGGEVFVPLGTWEVSTTITIVGSDIRLVMSGKATKIVAADGLDDAIILVGDDVNPYDGVVIANGEIDGNAANQAADGTYGIRLGGNISRSMVVNLWIHDTLDDGIKIGKETSVPRPSGIVIQNCSIYDMGAAGYSGTADGIDLDYADECIIIHNDIRTGTRTGTHDGVDLGNGSSRNLIAENVIVDCGNYGVYGDTSSNDNIVQGNIIKECTKSGVGFVGCTGNLIMNNAIELNDEHGIILSSSSHRSLIHDNTIRNNSQDSTSQGIRVTDSDEVIVSGNLVYDDQGPATQSVGVYLSNVDNCHIIDNTMFGNDNDGISLASCTGILIIGNSPHDNGRWGVLETGGSDYNMIVHNDCRGNTTGAISTLGANDIVNENFT